MLKKSGMIALVIGISILLSSCHIKQKPVETIARANGFLRIYQPYDFIEYNVTAISGTSLTPSIGMLRVLWEPSNKTLIDPIDGITQYPLDITVTMLKETTTLTYEPGSSEEDQTIIRYISQDSNGNVTLYAIDDGAGLYWLYAPDTTGNLSSDIVLPVISSSPMMFGPLPTESFSVMEGCGDTIGQCISELYKHNSNFDVVGDSTPVTTNLGKFSNPFEISFSGGVIPQGSPTISFWTGIHNACGSSSDQISHTGTMYVMPEIGMIRMTDFQCINSSTGSNVNYIITIRNTSFY